MNIQPTSTYRQIPGTRRHVVLLRNPIAGSQRRARSTEKFCKSLSEADMRVAIYTDLEAATERSRQLDKSGDLRALVAAGGDGTVAELANRTDGKIPLAILPLGTENLMAKYLQVQTSPDLAARTVIEGYVQPFDAGVANGRLFLLMCSAGMDADIVQQLHSVREGPITHLSYIKPILESLRRYEYPEIRVHLLPADEKDAEYRPQVISARWAFCVNLPQYALGLKFAPQATGTDGLLDVCTFDRGSLGNALRYLASVITGHHQQLEDCHLVRAARLRLESDSEVHFQLDGDPGGVLPCEIEILTDRVPMLVPHTFLAG